MNLVLEFEGWCSLRLPTDPDPSDEPRGISGYTFAFAGEPDLDRILNLQPRAGDALPLARPEARRDRAPRALRTDGDGGAGAEGRARRPARRSRSSRTATGR